MNTTTNPHPHIFEPRDEWRTGPNLIGEIVTAFIRFDICSCGERHMVKLLESSGVDRAGQ